MSAKKKSLRPYLIGLALVFGIILTCQFLIGGCVLWTCAPSRPFSVYELEIPPHYFPENAIVNSLSQSSENFGAAKHADQTTYWNGQYGIAVYNVFRFRSIRQASKHMEGKSQIQDDFHEKSILNYESKLADEYVVNCGHLKGGPFRCDVDARYEEFVISFNAVIDEQMTYEEYEQILAYIDKQMISHLHP